jgi:two-component system, chemotaxis family, chemotaxis protein CheY
MKTLIVEDDFITRSVLLKTMITSGACDVAVNGEEAIQAFETALNNGVPYDLVCLDIMLPGIRGTEVLKALRQIEEWRGVDGVHGVKVIVTTSLEDPGTLFSVFRAGCEAYLVKPFSRRAIINTVRSFNLPVDPEPTLPDL